ncbi:hypothetical protein niasHT_027809 [Heterodera trifolii]|uniref:Tyrosine-protein kinase catalytic domain-containing protein n=1 Tax=Heterodera trifolii TaxID=157864 RepID=A0ABD2JFX8_9BILA
MGPHLRAHLSSKQRPRGHKHHLILSLRQSEVEYDRRMGTFKHEKRELQDTYEALHPRHHLSKKRGHEGRVITTEKRVGRARKKKLGSSQHFDHHARCARTGQGLGVRTLSSVASSATNTTDRASPVQVAIKEVLQTSTKGHRSRKFMRRSEDHEPFGTQKCHQILRRCCWPRTADGPHGAGVRRLARNVSQEDEKKSAQQTLHVLRRRRGPGPRALQGASCTATSPPGTASSQKTRWVKVADFGLAFKGPSKPVETGKPVPIRWLSPETMRERTFTPKSDTNAQQPYQFMSNNDVAPMVSAVLRGTRLRFPNVTPPPFAEFIRANVWTADDVRRYSMRDVLAWIEQHIDELIDDTTASRHDTTTATTTRNRGSRQGSRTGS